MTKHCFLLTTSHRDNAGRFEITLHAATTDGRPLVVLIDTFRPLFFVPRSTPADSTRGCAERKQLALRSLDGGEVDCLYFGTLTAARDMAERLRAQSITTYEADINPVNRFLMERLVRGDFTCEGTITEVKGGLSARNPRIRGERADVTLRTMSIDIETNVRTGEIYCVACSGAADIVFLRSAVDPRPGLETCPDERTMLQRFLAHVAAEDPDILLGWNVIDFDLRVIQERCSAARLAFTLGRGGVARMVESPRTPGHLNARVPGRVVLDTPTMLRAYSYTFEEYSLDYVASQMLGEHKLIASTGAEKIAEIDRLYAENPPELARYCLKDARLARRVFETAGILPNGVERSRLCGHLLDRTGGSVAAFEYLYLPRLHRAGYVARDLADVPPATRALSGGYVMEPAAGVYENVLVFDFRSLYPSIIMTFQIDPLGFAVSSTDRITNPYGTSFSRAHALLPLIITELMAARADAKRTSNKALSQAIKIIMNSFYGVLGTPACRFFAGEIAQTITETGQYLFKLTKEHIEQSTGANVIYGDTDSLFVLLGPGREEGAGERGSAIARETTTWLAAEMWTRYGAESALELQFETHFRRFLLPSVRGGTEGSKKHYCGSIERGGEVELVFKGMESVRSDWTDLAKEFQKELCLRLFRGQPVEDYVLSTVNAVRAGALDSSLVYRRRLRKSADEYTTNVPPHAQAARLLDSPTRFVKYVITADGPQPIEKQTAPLDYEHYVDTQLRPIADTLLGFLGLDFERIVSGQQDLFG